MPAVIEDTANQVFVSSASAREGATKYRIGKLPIAGPLLLDFAGTIREQGFDELPISLAYGQDAGSFIGDHRDPFDRMLIAQARLERMALVSNEMAFDQYGVTRIW